MIQLIDDDKIRKCSKCQQEFVGIKIFEHEKVCQNQQIGQYNQQNINQIPAQRNYENNQIIKQQNFINYPQEILKNLIKCEYCCEDYPSDVYNLHTQNCDAKKQFQTILQSQYPSQFFNQNPQNDQEQEDEKQKLEILTKYIELIEKNGDILEKGEELVKISNFSIEPFKRIFKIQMCKFCKKNFNLDEEIIIMKCCIQLYHQICFAQIIQKTNYCECGKQIING